MEHLKCVVVGDGAVGKTCMLLSYTTNGFDDSHLPTIFDNYAAPVMLSSGEVVKLDLWDTAGQEDYDSFRPLSYPSSDVFLLCFSLISRTSLLNAISKWAPELRAYDTRNKISTPIILVGTKKDLRDDAGLNIAKQSSNTNGLNNFSTSDIISNEEGAAAASKMGCAAYVECSSLTQDGLKAAFDTAINHAMKKKKMERDGGEAKGKCQACTIM